MPLKYPIATQTKLLTKILSQLFDHMNFFFNSKFAGLNLLEIKLDLVKGFAARAKQNFYFLN